MKEIDWTIIKILPVVWTLIPDNCMIQILCGNVTNIGNWWNKNIVQWTFQDTSDLFCSLSVGYIDNLGRFITEIEPDPQRKYGELFT